MHYWWSEEKLMSNVFLLTPTQEKNSVGQPGKTYIHQFSVDVARHLDDLPKTITDWDIWWEID